MQFFWLYIALFVVNSRQLCKLENTYLARIRAFISRKLNPVLGQHSSWFAVPAMAPVEPRNYYKQPRDLCLWPYIHSDPWMLSYSSHRRAAVTKDQHRDVVKYHREYIPPLNSLEFILWSLLTSSSVSLIRIVLPKFLSNVSLNLLLNFSVQEVAG